MALCEFKTPENVSYNHIHVLLNILKNKHIEDE